ncbi:MAG: serine hydrolase, partial [Chitinophagaceae bacterium]
QTVISLTDNEKQLLTQGYNEKGEAVPTWKFKSLAACGAIKSNTYDLLMYGKSQLSSNNNSLAKAIQLSHNPTFTNASEKVALGWIYLQQPNNNIIHHSGGTYGCRSLIAINKTKNIVVVVLSNNATNGDALGLKLFNALNNNGLE